MKCAKTNRSELDTGTAIHQALQSYMQALQFFDDTIDDYIYMYDMAAERVYLTDKIRKKFPMPPAGENGNAFSDWDDLVYPKDRKLMNHYRDLLAQKKITSFDIAYRLLDKQGNKVWVNVNGAVRQGDEHALLLVGRISEMAVGRTIDSLTGLWNADKFMDDMKHYLTETDGYLMILGIDNFKNINIAQGRSFGDHILKTLTTILEEQTAYPISLYRLDGDCFAVVFPEKQQEEILSYYNSINAAMQPHCTISAGIVAYHHGDTTDSGAVYQYAENALDRAKKEGKNRFSFFSSDDYQKNLEQAALLDELKTSVLADCSGFQLYYQPQILTRNFELYGVEALLRYDSPSRGRINPVDFIPLLEQSGLICPVGEWVLKTAVAQCKEWRKNLPNFHMSVNISYIQLQQDGIADTVLNILKEADLPGDALTIEITESIQLQDYPFFNKIFYEWKRYGIKVSIDDFGTGYSSLSYLKSIEIDEVKIDRCFVNRIQYNAYNYRLLSNMIELAHSAQIEVCCEGVETVEELMALQELHADLQQGYLFAKPYTKDQFEECYIITSSKAYQDRKAQENNFRHMDSNENQELLEVLRKEEISNIIEVMDEMVYVIDADTNDLYYLNAAGRRTTGVYDYKGCKCYQVLQGLNEPCEFCTKTKVCEDSFYVWELENQFLNRHYILKEKLIPWQGKIARLKIAIDITEKEVVSKSIQKKLEFEKAIVDSCKILARESDSEKSANDVVKIIGEFCQADRAYILKPDHEIGLWNLTWEWCAEGISSIQQLFPTELESFLNQNTIQRITAPIMRKNKMIGFVGVDHPRYQEEDRELIRTIAYFLGYSMIGEETQERLNELLAYRYEDILNHTDLGLWMIRINPKTEEHGLYPNQVLRRIMGIPKELGPKECYAYWYDRINDDYYDYVNHLVNEMIQTKKIIHLNYPWQFPSGNEVAIQCVGIRRADMDGMICLEGYHWIVNN